MTFTWRGQELELFDHGYNATRGNERGAELAIVQHWLDGPLGDAGQGLELGNVLSHYDDAGPWPARRIVDRYEESRAVENLDVFEVEGSYDWILSISTLEHVRAPGEDGAYNPFGGVAALHFLRGLLRPGGRMLVTVPLGHNAMLDRELLNWMRWTHEGVESATLVRLRDSWFETPAPVALPYGPTHGANSVWVGTWGES